ncbi:hypothetical protein PRUPE_1G387600 [Prunus persica]|uniref:Uncharacterized protein n=1 Tax=Prunus persica TaxID=3760 RepID=A0A251R9T1_PRUPE|nr:hypothetical protein PRUPE_1G387600 [Prunus persica]
MLFYHYQTASAQIADPEHQHPYGWFTNSHVPFGTWYPPTVQSSVNSLWNESGPGGHKRIASLTVACRYTRLFISDSFNCLPLPTCCKESVHVRATLVVSLPPEIIACIIKILVINKINLSYDHLV